ncbi:MAG: hypothetical protein IJ796_10475 [Lachnospiraceae bacterium]|nr:hypothetical protein [Lachnospiraceae bacterium]
MTPLSLKCKICGGKLVNDYSDFLCTCENCGNKWAMSDLIPNIGEYSHITDKLRRAAEMTAGSDASVHLGEAQMLLGSAKSDCLKMQDTTSAELLKFINEEIEEISNLKQYNSAKALYEKKDFRRALSGFEKIKDYRDSEDYIDKCGEMIKASRKSRIPFAVMVGMIIPAILALFLFEKAGLHIAFCIPVFVLLSGGLGFLIYRGGTPAVIIEILSFVLLVPLLIFALLAYVFHLGKKLSLIISIAAPILLIVVFIIMSERKN